MYIIVRYNLTILVLYNEIDDSRNFNYKMIMFWDNRKIIYIFIFGDMSFL